MINGLIAAALLVSTPAAGQVDVGRADWKSLPQLKAAERRLPTPGMVEAVQTLLASGKCALPAQSPNKFDITVPFAALVQPDGASTRVIVAETGCPELEAFVGRIVLQMAHEGDFQRTGAAKARWYSSELNFNLR